MKGVFIQQQLEFRLAVAGEGFRQGDSLPCTVAVKNRGGADQAVGDLYLKLACGDAKKVKDKAPDAFEVIAEASLLAPGTLKPGQEHTAESSFQLSKNSPISEKSQSLYLLYGSSSIPQAEGVLLLTIAPHSHVQTILEILESSYQFVLKGQKSAGDWLTAKYKAPASSRFSTVNELNLSFHFDADTLNLKYKFTVKKFEFAGGTSAVGIKKGKSEIDQTLEPARYLLPGGFVNHAGVEGAIGEVLDQIAPS